MSFERSELNDTEKTATQ